MDKRYLVSAFMVLLLVIGIWGIYESHHEKMPSGSIKRMKKVQFKKQPKAELAFYRADWEFKRTRDPRTNSLPSSIKKLERDFASRLPRVDQAGIDRQAGPDRSLLRTQTWSNRGPSNVSGRLLTVRIDRADENVILVGSASGGLWRSLDGGGSWIKTTPPNEVQSVSCLAQDARSGRSRTWYYGTGELLSTTDRRLSTLPRTVGYGSGIFKSTDNGASWQALSATRGGQVEAVNEVFQGIWNLALDSTRTEADIVYAAGYGAIMRSPDGGQTWEKSLGDLEIKSFATDVVCTDDGVLYAALSTFSTTGSVMAPRQSGLWRSTDGINWRNITPNDFPQAYRVIKLALAPSDQNILYVLTENPIQDSDPIFGFTASAHTFWKCTWNQASNDGLWEDRTDNLPGGGSGNILSDAFNSIGGYTMTLAVKPDDPDVVFIGGTNLYRSTSAFADSASTTQIGGYPYDFEPDNLHPDQHGLDFAPSDTGILFCANDGGLFITDNCLAETVTWRHLNNGLTTTQFFSAALDHAAFDDNFIIGGLQDNATQYTVSGDPTQPWTGVIGGDGLTAAVADNKEFILASVYNGQFFTFRLDQQYQAQDIYIQGPDELGGEDFNFYTNFILDPVSGALFYLPAKNRIWRKDDMAAAAKDPSLKNQGWTELTRAALPQGESVTALGLSTNPPHRLYYGSDTGRVFRLDNANVGDPAAREVTGDGFPSGGFTACLAVDPWDADKVFAVFSNYNVDSIFYSTDGGATWASQSGNLEENPDGTGAGPSVRWLEIVHFDSGTLYLAATSAGLYSTSALLGPETIWRKEGAETIGEVIVDMIDARATDGLVVVATQGNGVYSTRLTGPRASSGGGCFTSTTAPEF